MLEKVDRNFINFSFDFSRVKFPTAISVGFVIRSDRPVDPFFTHVCFLLIALKKNFEFMKTRNIFYFEFFLNILVRAFMSNASVLISKQTKLPTSTS